MTNRNIETARNFLADLLRYAHGLMDDSEQATFEGNLLSVESQRNEDGECVAFQIWDTFGGPSLAARWGIYTGGEIFADGFGDSEQPAHVTLMDNECQDIIEAFGLEF